MIWVGMVLWVLTVATAAWVLKTFDSLGMWRYLLALLPIGPAILIMNGMFRMIRREDELHRRVQFEAIAFAAVVVWLVTFSWGSLEIVGLARAIPGYWIATGLVFLYGFGGWYFRRRYQ